MALEQATVLKQQRRASPSLPNEEIRSGHLAVLSYLHWPTADSSETLSVGLTSCTSGEGVSTAAVQLATTAAALGLGEVLLVDANLAKPCLHRILSVPGGPGLAEYLLGEQAIDSIIEKHVTRNLSLLPAGNQTKAATHLLVADRVSRLQRELESTFSLVLFDMPSCQRGSTTLGWAGGLDSVILVVEAERVRSEAARRVKEELKRAGANLRGAVLNKHREHIPGWLYRAV